MFDDSTERSCPVFIYLGFFRNTGLSQKLEAGCCIAPRLDPIRIWLSQRKKKIWSGYDSKEKPVIRP